MKKIAILMLAMAISSGVIMPKKSHAYLVIGGFTEWTTYWYSNGPFLNTFLIVLCGTTLPFCLLDEAGNETQVSRADLLSQGYSEMEVNVLMNDQAALAEALAKNNLKLEFRKNESSDVLRDQILSVRPETSEEYMNFLFEVKGVK